MDNTRNRFEKLRQEVASGNITCDDIIKRLTVAIETEYLKDSPNVDYINMCEDFLWEIGTQGQQKYVSANDRYLQAIQQHTAQFPRTQNANARAFRWKFSCSAVVLLVLLGLSLFPIRWFTHESTIDSEQYILRGHEITVEMFSTAQADGLNQGLVIVQDFSEFRDILGFDPRIPTIWGTSWIADHGSISNLPGYIKITAIYRNKYDSAKIITCTINYFTDIEYAYFSFEQSKDGAEIQRNGYSMYVTQNIDNTVICWYDANMYIWFSGNLDTSEATRLMLDLIGGTGNE